MEILLILIVATVASFVGSLQAGLVNTAVLSATLRHGQQAGRNTAFGGSIPEFLYAAVAFVGAERILEWAHGFGGTVDRIAGAVMILLGLYFLFLLKPFPATTAEMPKRTGFWRGLLLGLMNPQLLLFWCGVRLGMDTFGLQVGGPWGAIAFGLGAFTGAMILLLLLVRLGRRMQERLGGNLLRNVFRILGLLLVVAGVVAWVGHR